MNFFTLDQETFRFVTSPKLWIYFVSAVILTVFTMLLYFAMAGFPQIHRSRKKTDVEMSSFSGRRKLSVLGS